MIRGRSEESLFRSSMVSMLFIQHLATVVISQVRPRGTRCSSPLHLSCYLDDNAWVWDARIAIH
jgi:hypothetical protein